MKGHALQLAVALALATSLSACGSSGGADPTAEIQGSRISTEAVTRGCRTVCAKCKPNEACPDLCRLECPPDVVPCGRRVCHSGSVCCNESCGICTPPGGTCNQDTCETQQPCVETALCIIGFHWSPTQCQCVADGSCSSDSDCRLVADYCSGCDCRGLSNEDADPTCDGPGVQCFADPCLNKAARCVDGQCMAESQCVQTQLCIRGLHWSPSLCRCVRDRPHAPSAPRQPHTPHSPR